MNQKIFINYLEKRGYIYHTANNGIEALDKFDRFRFDLIFMDVEMPLMGGLECTKMIREKEKALGKKKTRIIGLSGNARKEHIEQAIRVGMDGYLTKPYHREDIYKLIDNDPSKNPMAINVGVTLSAITDNYTFNNVLWQAAIDSSRDLIYAIDKDLKYIVVNRAGRQAALKIFKKEIGLGMSILEHLEPFSQALLFYRRALVGESSIILHECISSDGLIKNYEMYFSPIKAAENLIVGALCFAREQH